MPKDYPEQIETGALGFPDTISETTPIVDTHEGYGWIAAPVARRLEGALKQRIYELEKKVAKLESNLLDIASLNENIWRYKRQIRSNKQ